MKDKGGAALVLELGGPHEDEPSNELGMALKSLAKALKSEDWSRAEDAFREAVYACDEDEDKDAEEDAKDDESDDDGDLSL